MTTTAVPAAATVSAAVHDRFARIVGAQARHQRADPAPHLRVRRPARLPRPPGDGRAARLDRRGRRLRASWRASSACRSCRAARARGSRAARCRSKAACCIGLSRMKQILDDRSAERASCACSPASSTSTSSARSRADGYYYAPDPSSQSVCTIGGNVAENSGGAHCLKYGFTVNHALGLTHRAARRRDRRARLARRRAGRRSATTWSGVVVGSEGMLGIVTEVLVRVLRAPEQTRTIFATFPSTDEAGDAVSRDHRRGHHPGRDRDDGPARDRGDRRGDRRRLAARRRRAAADGRRRRRRRGRAHRRRARPRTCARPARSRSARRDDDAERRAGVERPQGGVRRDGPHLAQLPRPGRRHPAQGDRAGAARDRRARRARPGCASPTSSTPATATCTRWCSTTRASPGQEHAAETVARRDPARLPALRRLGDRRARRRPRQGVLSRRAVRRRRPRHDGDRSARAFDPERHVQPRQGVPDAAPVRRQARALRAARRAS